MYSSYLETCVYIIDQARGQNGWIYWISSLTAFLLTETKWRFIAMRKENVANIQLSSPIYSLVNKGFIMTLHAIIYPTLFLLLCLPVSVAKCILETLQHLVFILVDTFRRFSHFLVPSQQGNHRKSFCCHRKYFAKESRKKKEISNKNSYLSESLLIDT